MVVQLAINRTRHADCRTISMLYPTFYSTKSSLTQLKSYLSKKIYWLSFCWIRNLRKKYFYFFDGNSNIYDLEKSSHSYYYLHIISLKTLIKGLLTYS